jgi:Svf1-like C-terminal lipocalin-like domain/Svf1-like N-terminal lipocalin domain
MTAAYVHLLIHDRGIHTTTQFQTKIFDHDGAGKHLFCSDPLQDYGFDERQTGFFAENVALELNQEGDTYTIKSAANEGCLVNLKVKRQAPGFQLGKDGTSYYGTDSANPWGSMHHRFWPRCTVEGTMQTSSKTYNMKGRGLYIKALQGMKPHHAAAKWNFVYFTTPTYTAVLMEFTTPSSYGRTVVSLGGIARDGALLYAGPTTMQHTSSAQDTEIDWPEPKAISAEWKGKDTDGKDCDITLEGDLPTKTDRVDVLSHIPGFIKSIVGGVVGTRPYIYQVNHRQKFLGDSTLILPSTARRMSSS